MKDLIGAIARAIVDASEQVAVSEVEGDHTLVLEFKIGKTKYGEDYRQAGQDSSSHPNYIECGIRKNKKTLRS